MPNALIKALPMGQEEAFCVGMHRTNDFTTDAVRAPFTALQRWSFRIWWLVAVAALGTGAIISDERAYSLLLIPVAALLPLFEVGIRVYWRRRDFVRQKGIETPAVILNKKVTWRGGFSTVKMRYRVGTNDYEAWGYVSPQTFVESGIGDTLSIKVNPRHPTGWTV